VRVRAFSNVQFVRRGSVCVGIAAGLKPYQSSVLPQYRVHPLFHSLFLSISVDSLLPETKLKEAETVCSHTAEELESRVAIFLKC